MTNAFCERNKQSEARGTKQMMISQPTCDKCWQKMYEDGMKVKGRWYLIDYIAGFGSFKWITILARNGCGAAAKRGEKLSNKSNLSLSIMMKMAHKFPCMWQFSNIYKFPLRLGVNTFRSSPLTKPILFVRDDVPRTMRVKFISTKYWSYFPFFMASIFPSQPTPMRRGFAYQTWVKSYFCATQKPPRKKHSPRRDRRTERREKCSTKNYTVYRHINTSIPLWTKKGERRKMFFRCWKCTQCTQHN